MAPAHVVATAQLTHVRLLVDDFPGCFRFYRHVIGLAAGIGSADGPYAEFDTGGSVLALWARSASDIAADVFPAGGAAMIVFRVWDVDESIRHMRARGGRFDAEPRDVPEWGLRVARLRDPAGNLVEINARLKAHKQTTGDRSK